MSQETVSLEQVEALDAINAAIRAAGLVGRQGYQHAADPSLPTVERLAWLRLVVRADETADSLYRLRVCWQCRCESVDCEVRRREAGFRGSAVVA